MNTSKGQSYRRNYWAIRTPSGFPNLIKCNVHCPFTTYDHNGTHSNLPCNSSSSVKMCSNFTEIKSDVYHEALINFDEFDGE